MIESTAETAAPPTVFDQARSLLHAPSITGNPWATLAASALAAMAAVLMAGAVVLGPGFEIDAPATMTAER